MFRRWLLLTVFVWIFSSNNAFAKKTPPGDLVEMGDQAKVEIARGFFIDSEVGLLTFLPMPIPSNDGAEVYRPGFSVGFRFGGYLTKSFSLYGKVAASVTGNTACYGDTSNRNCAETRKKFPTAGILRGIPRQGLSVLFGLGSRLVVLELDERFKFHLSFELLGQLIPPDNIPESRINKLDATTKDLVKIHQEMAIGVVPGIGFGMEYFFFLKHFSVSADARFYYFLTPFMPKTFLGTALLVSVGLKYSF